MRVVTIRGNTKLGGKQMPELTSLMPQRASAEAPWDPEKGLDLTRQPKWNIPEIVAIEAAVVGHPIKRATNPNQPLTTTEIRNEAIASIEAGAVAVHLHVRDENTGNPENDPKVYIRKMKEVCEPLRDKYGYDVVLTGCCLLPTFEEEKQLAEIGLLEMSPVNAFYRSPSKLFKAEVQMMQELDIKPQIALYCDGDLDRAIQWFVESDLPKEPLNWIYLPSYVTGGTPLPNEFAMVDSLVWMVRRLREIDPNSVITVCNSGRASSYLSTFAMLMGLHVRVGMEDSIFCWPHKDDLVKNNATVIKDTIKTAKLLGRRPATAKEFRKIMGLKPR